LKIEELAGSTQLFDVKITDVTPHTHPFLLYKNIMVDKNGYVIFRPDDPSDPITLDPVAELPWIDKIRDIRGHTLKIEVSTPTDLILLRFIHYEKFTPIAYSLCYLEIGNSFFQATSLMKGGEQVPDIQIKGVYTREEGQLL